MESEIALLNREDVERRREEARGYPPDQFAFINWLLMHSYRPRGVILWWDRARPQLGGSTPLQVFEHDPDRVVWLAMGSLEQQGT